MNCDIDEAFKWLKLAKEFYKVEPIIYSEYFFYKILLKSKNPDCILWQYKQDKSILKFNENIDFNVFLGDSTKFKTILIR